MVLVRVLVRVLVLVLVLVPFASAPVTGQARQLNEFGTRVRADVGQHQKEIVDELLQLLAIPNIAADKVNIRRNAEHLQRLLTKHKFAAEILETSGNPLVFAQVARSAESQSTHG